MPTGLNENYGRELLELHTLGVDGGYTQKDVTEVARAFTGWTIENPRQRRRVPSSVRSCTIDGEKVVLGHKITAGAANGTANSVLDILATHPATARFIATKLARRFVSDTPPPALVDHLRRNVHQTKGDLRAVMTDAPARRPSSSRPTRSARKSRRRSNSSSARCGRPAPRSTTRMSLVRAMQRAGHAALSVPAADRLQGHGRRVGQHRRARQPDERRAGLASGRQPGVTSGESAACRSRSSRNDMSDVTRTTIAKATSTRAGNALALGSPEFQRH